MTKAEAIGPNGRTVRCAKCSSTWFVSAEEALNVTKRADPDALALQDDLQEELIEQADIDVAPIAPAVNAGAHVTIRDKADAQKLARRRRVIWAIWLIPLGLLIIGAVLAFMFRQDVVNRVPEAATIYKTFGLTVKEAGLEIENPTARMALVDGQTVLIVSSAIRNVSRDSRSIPMVQLSLHNGTGEAVAQWYVEPKKPTLNPKDRLEFVTQYPDPPVDAVSLRYDFSDGA